MPDGILQLSSKLLPANGEKDGRLPVRTSQIQKFDFFFETPIQLTDVQGIADNTDLMF